jgi:hypothetical protein
LKSVSFVCSEDIPSAGLRTWFVALDEILPEESFEPVGADLGVVGLGAVAVR